MRNVRATREGLILPVKVISGASKNEIVGWQDGYLKIKVSAPPEKGKANIAVIQLLAKTLQLPQNKIILLKGANGRQKEILLEGCTKLEFEHLGL